MENWLIKILANHICDDGQFNGCHMRYWNNKIKKKERNNLLCPMWLAIEYIRYYWIVWEKIVHKNHSSPIYPMLLLRSSMIFLVYKIKRWKWQHRAVVIKMIFSFIFHSATNGKRWTFWKNIPYGEYRMCNFTKKKTNLIAYLFSLFLCACLVRQA